MRLMRNLNVGTPGKAKSGKSVSAGESDPSTAHSPSLPPSSLSREAQVWRQISFPFGSFEKGPFQSVSATSPELREQGQKARRDGRSSQESCCPESLSTRSPAPGSPWHWVAEGSPVGTHVLRNEIRTGFLEKGLSRQQEARDSISGGEKCVDRRPWAGCGRRHVHQAGGGGSRASPKQTPWPVTAETSGRHEGSQHRVSSTQASPPRRQALTAGGGWSHGRTELKAGEGGLHPEEGDQPQLMLALESVCPVCIWTCVCVYACVYIRLFACTGDSMLRSRCLGVCM